MWRNVLQMYVRDETGMVIIYYFNYEKNSAWINEKKFHIQIY